MKKWIMFAAVLSTTAAFAQTNTNKEGSKYEFTTIKDLEATGVQNQGQTGTCWSFPVFLF
ncbi:hypothetical protein MKQ70_28465 [Chitinophaga sedimenti]|uniref:hypothetical protein n=1 Tax=Chitinophaga sedimenti TaxID=2033606 RepID=UPI0020055E97|nr:hypothetical protein [Chitinophaga sedimenti]MCK7558712.1 hypothetical protein [Chitinophaga sedimenti]